MQGKIKYEGVRETKRIKKFLKDNQWSIIAIIGGAAWIALFVKTYESAMEVIRYYVTFANL